MRTFVAIDLDPDLKTRLAAFIDELRPLAKNVRWVNAPGMHLTLKFLGEIGDGDVAGISAALEGAVRGRQTFPLALRGTGAFPPGRRHPRVLWVGIDQVPGLVSLQAEIETAMEKRGFEREARPFHPHLTLGRIKVPAPLDRLVAELERNREREFGEMTVGRFVFYRSILKPSGAEYSVLKEIKLG